MHHYAARRKMRQCVLATVFLWSASGCTPRNKSTSTADVAVRDSAGVEMVTSHDGRLTRVVSRSNARHPPTEQEVAGVEEAERCRVGVASLGRDYLLAIRQNEDGIILVEVLPLRRSS